MATKEVRELLKREFDYIGNCVTNNELKNYKLEFFWNTIDEFLNDKEILISPDQMVENYLFDMLEAIENYDSNLTKDVVNNIFLQLWADDDVYIDTESIKNNYSYSNGEL